MTTQFLHQHTNFTQTQNLTTPQYILRSDPCPSGMIRILLCMTQKARKDYRHQLYQSPFNPLESPPNLTREGTYKPIKLPQIPPSLPKQQNRIQRSIIRTQSISSTNSPRRGASLRGLDRRLSSGVVGWGNGLADATFLAGGQVRFRLFGRGL